jgi:hypothetical protein
MHVISVGTSACRVEKARVYSIPYIQCGYAEQFGAPVSELQGELRAAGCARSSGIRLIFVK